MSKPLVSLIVTVLNEAKSISELLTSISKQKLLPAEVVIADGGSSDGTQKIIQDFSQKNPNLNVQLINIAGNRSLGRNAAINKAKYNLIAITDAGCELDKNWLSELIICQEKNQADVVAGYYRGQASSSFQVGLVPYALVMPNKLPKTNQEVFLPATRSMLILKSIWQKAGGFDENLSHNEDFAFAQTLVKLKTKFAFCQSAIVNWQPPASIFEATMMFYRFALGDAEAKILRPKVGLIFARYFLALSLIWYFIYNSLYDWLALSLGIFVIGYACWSILKNYQYAKSGWFWLPIIQVLSDLAVMFGTLIGGLKSK